MTTDELPTDDPLAHRDQVDPAILHASIEKLLTILEPLLTDSVTVLADVLSGVERIPPGRHCVGQLRDIGARCRDLAEAMAADATRVVAPRSGGVVVTGDVSGEKLQMQRDRLT